MPILGFAADLKEDPRVAEELRLLQSGDYELATRAAGLLGERGITIEPILLELAKHYVLPEDYSYRQEPGLNILPQAVAALGHAYPEVVIRWLASEDPHVRLCAAVSAASKGRLDPRLEDALRSSLADPNPQLRAMATIALGDEWPSIRNEPVTRLKPQTIAALLDLLGDGEIAELPFHENGSSPVARWAIHALKADGRLESNKPQVLPRLVELLSDNAQAKSSALELLRNFPEDARRPELLARISALSADPDPDVRGSAIETIADLDPAAAVPLVLKGLHDPEWRPSMEAGFALEKLPSLEDSHKAQIIDSWHFALANNKHYIYSELLRQMEARWPRDAEVLSATEAGLKLRDSTARWGSARLLVRNHPDPVALVQRLSGDSNLYVRASAALIIGEGTIWAPEALAVLGGLMSDSSNEVRAIAVDAAGKLALAAEPLIDQVVLALNDPDDRVRERARYSLSTLVQFYPRVLPQLYAVALDSTVPHWDRLKVMNAVAALAPTSAETSEMLKRAFEADDPDFHNDAVLAAAKICDVNPEALRIVLAGADDPEEWIRMTAIDALGEQRITSPEAVKAIVFGLDDPEARVRMAAVVSLGNIGDVVPGVEPLLTWALADVDADVGERAARSLFRLRAIGAVPQTKTMGPDWDVTR